MLADTFSFTESVFLFDSELAVLVYSVVVVYWSYKESDDYEVPSPADAASPAPL
tara:strand:+ start:360 stop:521 length:162 start_codon:yes stop_codon:yes gene_type:complete